MKKELSNQKSIYIHMDNVINNVVTSGITFCDFMQGVPAPPENILLIKHHFKDTSYNAHTAFHYLESNDLKQLKQAPLIKFNNFCWVDFEDIELVNQLSPQEVAELLYLAHTGRHLRSPFYYKLQNNFVYLTKKDGRYNKVYYRNMNHFYVVLSQAITRKTEEIIHEKSFLMPNRRKSVALPPSDLLKKMMKYFKEGACISFAHAEKSRTQLRVPVGIEFDEELSELEDSPEELTYNEVVAELVYDLRRSEWDYIEK
ncbi:hypothetical protein ACSMFR_10960 [Listeria aquatica]|uniref:hypothetical protein n=1 Tax=Listeria aquatica TaxID=1494960 RepID=UPI003F6FBB2D